MNFPVTTTTLLLYLTLLVSATPAPSDVSVPKPSEIGTARRSLDSAFSAAMAAGVDPLGAHPSDYISANAQYISFSRDSKFALWARVQMGRGMDNMYISR
jgi:hypothetical protein